MYIGLVATEEDVAHVRDMHDEYSPQANIEFPYWIKICKQHPKLCKPWLENKDSYNLSFWNYL